MGLAMGCLGMARGQKPRGWIHSSLAYLPRRRPSFHVSDRPSARSFCAMAGDTAQQCCICLTPYGQDEPPYRLTCGHFVHSACMLAGCLVSVDDHKCPYCRAVVGARRHGAADDDDGDIFEDDEGSEISEGEVALAELMPQWRRVNCGPWLHSSERRRLQGVAQRLLERSQNKGAPPALRRYGDSVKAAAAELATERAKRRHFHARQLRQTAAAVVAADAALGGAVRRAQQRLFAARRALVLRCRKSRTCWRYLAEHPPRIAI